MKNKKKKKKRKGRSGTGWGEIRQNVERSGTDETLWSCYQKTPDSAVACQKVPQHVNRGADEVVSVLLTSEQAQRAKNITPGKKLSQTAVTGQTAP